MKDESLLKLSCTSFSLTDYYGFFIARLQWFSFCKPLYTTFERLTQSIHDYCKKSVKKNNVNYTNVLTIHSPLW